ncbi:MAG: 1-phosphofructokinase family hexose kinase [Rhodobacteraceae bacterium]|nr:1-phosphofructokinase family hexose kinase [Paracoccaceae bacterium]
MTGLPAAPPPQLPVLTVTLNPALDIAARGGPIVPGVKLRLEDPVRHPGGGGVNVARGVLRLGGRVRAFLALGGGIGRQVAALLEHEGVPLYPFEVPGETRQSLTVHTEDPAEEFRFVLPGPHWPDGLSGFAVARIAGLAEAGWVVLSGSQPPGTPDDLPARLAARLGPRVALAIDISGPPLARLLRGGEGIGRRPALLRLDEVEAAELAGAMPSDPAAMADLGQSLLTRGVAEAVVVAMGAAGSVLVRPGQRLHCLPPSVEVRSKVGAGDSFVAALVLTLARGKAWDEALLMATAAAASAVTSPGTELFVADDLPALVAACRMEVV